ncbi:MAG: D-alanyl-D-alanine carboxypeptidase family protein [Hyphomicrobium sp.]|jgi:hypothetical protein
MADLSQFAVGGAQRPDSFSGLQPEFRTALSSMFADAPPDIQAKLRIGSGFRSPQRQAELWDQALKKYGSPEAARKWVAPPGRSQHNHGNASDLKYLDPSAQKWAHENAARYGLAFPLANENWHIEMANARGNQPNLHGMSPDMQQVNGQPPAQFRALPAGMDPRGMSPDMQQMYRQPAPPAGGLADLFNGPGTTAGLPGEQQAMMGLAGLFAQQQDRRKREEEEAAAEQVKRAALFAPTGVGPYG